MKRPLALAGALVTAGIALAPTAAAADDIWHQAASGLHNQPVYITSDSGAVITAKEVQKLDQEITKYSIPVYIAILPDSANAGVGVDHTPEALGGAMGRTAVYAVVAGHNFRANSNGALPSGETASIANDAFANNSPRDNDGRIYPMLSDFVKHVDYAIHPEDKPKTNWGLIWTILGSIAGGIAAIALAAWGIITGSRRRAEKREAERVERERVERLEQARREVQAWYTRLQDDVLGLGVHVNDQAKACHSQALEALTRADNLISSAKTNDDLGLARGELQTAEAAISDAKAYDQGRDPVAEREAERKERERLAAEARKEADRRALEAAKEAKARAAEEERRRKEFAKKVKAGEFVRSSRKTRDAPHYYSGGRYNGVVYAPGYYSDPFWNYVILSELMRGDEGYVEPHHSSYSDSSSSYSGSSSSSSSSDSSYDSFSGGGSWGGGSDFGGGGGGGFDSSSGGGSW